MKEKFSELLKNKNFARILFIVGIVGILLIFLSSFFSDKKEKTQTPKDAFSETEYLSGLKEDIKTMVTAICGDDGAVVTVTLDTGMVYEYAEEIKKNDRADGTNSSRESEQKYITVEDSAGAEVPLIITSYMPRVRGVSIICNYDSEETADKIRNAVQAALDITSRKIHISKR